MQATQILQGVRSLGLALIAFVSGMGLAAAAEKDIAGTLLVVFDSSGSMWGQLQGGGTKFEEAHRALARSLPAPETAVETGLVVFGPGCGNVDVAAQPGLRQGSETVAAIPSLNPRSKGPSTAGVETALGMLSAGRPASIVLVADGADNCQRDLCRLAEEIGAQRSDLHIHVVALGLPQPPPDLTCAATATGGRVFPVETPADADAGIAEAVEAALLDLGPRNRKPLETAAPGAGSSPDAAARIDPKGPPHLVLKGHLGEQKNVLEQAVRWRVYKGAAPPGPEATPILDVLEAQLALPLAGGDYHVRADLDRARVAGSVSVSEAGPTEFKAGFNAGIARISVPGSAVAGQRPGSLVTIRPAEEGMEIKGPILLDATRTRDIVLPAGRYLIATQNGPAETERPLAIAAGAVQELELQATTGDIVPLVSGAMEGEGLMFRVSVDDPDATGGRRVLARSAARQPTFQLPAGTYYVEAEQGLARSRARVALGAGRIEKTPLNLQAGRIALTARVPDSAAGAGRPAIYKLYGADGRDLLAQSSAARPNFVVPPGRYRLVAEIGARNVRAEGTIDIAPGDDRQVALAVDAGEIQLRVSDDKGRALAGQFWEVLDSGGSVVWRTQQSSPRGLLAPGRYTVRCETRRGLVEGVFEVASGDAKTIELRVP